METSRTDALNGSTIDYTYDAGDRVTQIADSTGGTIARTYDDLDRLTQEQTPEGTVSYTYDAAGRRATMTVTGQPSVVYTWDNANRLTQIAQGTDVVAFTYDNANRRTSTTLANGVLIAYGYDDANELTSIAYSKGGTAIGDLTYAYDAAGQRTSVGGSLAATDLPAALSSAVYNANNQLTSWAGSSLTYDLNGNLTADATNTYTWKVLLLPGGLHGLVDHATRQIDGDLHVAYAAHVAHQGGLRQLAKVLRVDEPGASELLDVRLVRLADCAAAPPAT
jgi:YD repeat-containing protein